VDSDGYIYVNEEKLDRDPPNPGKYRFQVNTNLYKFMKLAHSSVAIEQTIF